MRKILRDLVVAWAARDRDGDERAGVLLPENGASGLRSNDLKPVVAWRNIRVHAQIADQVYDLGMEIESAAEIGLRAGDPKRQVLAGSNPILNPGRALQR